MLNCSYGNEPVDSKLLAIQFLKRIRIILFTTVLGAVVFGMCYFIKNVVLAPEPTYEAHSMLYVDFVEDSDGPKYYTFNTAGWSGFVKTDDILERAMTCLEQDEQATALSEPITKEEMRESVSASVDADYRVVDLIVKNANPDRAVLIAHAVEKGFLEFGKDMREIDQVRVMTTAAGAEQNLIDTATYRAVIWGAVLACIVAIFVVWMVIILDDSIYVPLTFERRYRIPMLGAVIKHGREQSDFAKTRAEEIQLNYKKVCPKGKAAVIPIADISKLSMGEMDGIKGLLADLPVIANPVICPKSIEAVSTYDYIILEVPYGAHNGKLTELTIAQLTKAGCPVKAAVLIDADEMLLRTYYGNGICKKNRNKN